MVKTKQRKNESPEAGPEASDTPDQETPVVDDKGEEDPSNRTVLAAIATLKTPQPNLTPLSTLQTTVDRMTTKLQYLDEKCEDLEARSRRNNIRIMGIPEGKEGPRPRDFITQFLTDILSLPQKPLVDWAHRINRQKPKPGDLPRPFILRLHYYHIREEILQKAMEMNNLEYMGQKICIFPDFPPSVVKQRAAFTKVREMLRGKPDVKYGLIYPARLLVTHGDTKRSFTDPREAQKYAEKRNRSTGTVFRQHGHTGLIS